MPCGCREPCHLMRPARIRGGGRRAGLVVVAGWPYRSVGECRPRAGVDVVTGEDGGRCSAGDTRAARRRGGVVRDQEMIKAFAAQGADEPFRDRVCAGCPDRGPDDLDVGAGEDRVERGGEFAVPIADQEPEPVGSVVEFDEQVAGLLGDPGAGGVGGDPGEVHAAATVLDDNEDVETAQQDCVYVGEVDGEDRVGLGGQELSPGRPGPSGGRDRYPLPSGSSTQSMRLPDGRGRPTRPESFCSPRSDSRRPSAAPGPGSVVGWVGGLIFGAGRSSGEQRGGCANAAGFWARQAVAGAAR
jgi:hypothetical protein